MEDNSQNEPMPKFIFNEKYISREPTVLKNHTPISTTTIHGWPSLLFGLPFLIAGLAILGISGGFIEVDPGSVHAPMWVIGAAGSMFFFAGIALITNGIQGIKRQKIVKEGIRSSKSTPWDWDYPEDSHGVSEKKGKQVLNYFVAALAFVVFLAPFNWWAFVSDESNGMIIFVVGFFDLIILFVIGHFFYNLIQYFRFGSSFLQFHRFPFYLGDSLSAVLLGMPKGTQIDMIRLHLRFIEERYETSGSGRNRTQRVVPYQLYGDTRKISGSELDDRGELNIEWQLPPDENFESEMSRRPACYWELDIDAELPGVNYHARFLLPVYRK